MPRTIFSLTEIHCLLPANLSNLPGTSSRAVTLRNPGTWLKQQRLKLARALNMPIFHSVFWQHTQDGYVSKTANTRLTAGKLTGFE